MATIEPTADGPLKVTGVQQCVNSRGEAIALEETSFLCRCGGSANKPFCDGSHERNGFKSSHEKPVAPAAPAAAAGAAPPGAPRIEIRKNGPLAVIGVADLKCATAPTDPARYSLCRCGSSKNKPYCDGSHRSSGFSDDKN